MAEWTRARSNHSGRKTRRARTCVVRGSARSRLAAAHAGREPGNPRPAGPCGGLLASAVSPAGPDVLVGRSFSNANQTVIRSLYQPWSGHLATTQCSQVPPRFMDMAVQLSPTLPKVSLGLGVVAVVLIRLGFVVVIIGDLASIAWRSAGLIAGAMTGLAFISLALALRSLPFSLVTPHGAGIQTRRSAAPV